MACDELGEPDPTTQPLTRGDCLDDGVNAARPCKWITCRYHLYNIEMSCALDAADEGPTELETIGEWMNLTSERIRQIEEIGLRKLKRLPLLRTL